MKKKTKSAKTTCLDWKWSYVYPRYANKHVESCYPPIFTRHPHCFFRCEDLLWQSVGQLATILHTWQRGFIYIIRIIYHTRRHTDTILYLCTIKLLWIKSPAKWLHLNLYVLFWSNCCWACRALVSWMQLSSSCVCVCVCSQSFMSCLSCSLHCLRLKPVVLPTPPAASRLEFDLFSFPFLFSFLSRGREGGVKMNQMTPNSCNTHTPSECVRTNG